MTRRSDVFNKMLAGEDIQADLARSMCDFWHF